MDYGLSEPLWQWLTDSKYDLSLFKNRQVVVVGLLGKESCGHSKIDPINALLKRAIVFSRTESTATSTTASIDVFYAPELSVLFLRLTGYGDVDFLRFLAKRNDGDENNEVDPGKSFFERISQMDVDYARCLTILLLLTHLILFVEPCCRFDSSFLRCLRSANELRLSYREAICEKFSAISDFPRQWTIEGRLARPRFLFSYYRHEFRAELTSTKKKELINKLEQSIENQIYSAMRSHRLIGTNKSTSCGSLQRAPFVRVYTSSEISQNNARDCLLLHPLLNVRENDENDRSRDMKYSKESETKCDLSFGSFLKLHINDVLDSSEKGTFFEIPTLKSWMIGGKVVCNEIFKSEVFDADEIAIAGSVELRFLRNMRDEYISSAKAVYMSRDFDKTKNLAVFTKTEHQTRLKRALEKFESVYRGDALERTKKQLIGECEAIWNSQRACEVVSLTGNECILPVHHALTDLEVSPSKRQAHSSGARYLATCNCGHSQTLCNDPFTLKEANYDFYAQSRFMCCRNLERYNFDVFRSVPTSIVAQSVSDLECTQKSICLSDENIEDLDFPLAEDNLDMLLDRDNRLEEDENHQENVQSFKGNHGDFANDDGDVGGGEESVVVPSHSCSDTNIRDVIGDDINNDGDVVDGDDEEEDGEDDDDHENEFEDEQNENTDEYNSSPVEEGVPALEEGVKACYLDEDDVQLRNIDVDEGEMFGMLNLCSEEILVDLRKNFKGQFLECVPNTESPQRRPLFPSWSLLCLGPSSLYSHKAGLRDMPNFKIRSQFLLPVDIFLTVDSGKWNIDVQDIFSDSPSLRSKRPLKIRGSNREKVKLFVGYEYECPRGHRFLIQESRMSFKGVTVDSKEYGEALLRSDIPLWMQCTCRRMPQVSAQLMRLHVVTPKAPVTVTLNPRVQPTAKDPIFHTGENPLSLEWAKYYILRFPYVYAGPHGPIYRPSGASVMGKVFANCIKVEYISLH